MTLDVSRYFRLLAFGWLVGSVVSAEPLAAQDSRLSVIVPEPAEIVRDLETMVARSDQPEQWDNLSAYLDVFLQGGDRERPVRIDIAIDPEAARYTHYYPIEDKKDFLENVKGFGITTRRLFGRDEIYKLTGGYDGYLHISKDDDYGRIVNEIREVKGSSPILDDPTEVIADVLELDVSAAGQIVNANADEAADRRAGFERIRDEAIAKLKQMEDEGDTDFELRKLATRQQLDEAGRFYAESKNLLVTIDRDPKANTAKSTLSFEALDGTDLGESAKEFGTVPPYFSGITQPERAPLSLRLRHPLDEMRQKNLNELLTLSKRRMLERVEITDGLTDEEKPPTREAIDVIAGLFEAGIESGVVDLMVDVLPISKTEHRLIAGVRTPDGTPATKLLDLLPKIDPGVTVEKAVAETDGVTIHRINLPAEGPARDYFTSFYADDGQIFLGIGKQTLYLAAGPDALPELQKVITTADDESKRGDKSLILSFLAQPGPWVERRERRNSTGDPELRKRALNAFGKGNDLVVVEMRRDGEKIVGEASFESGILDFVGSVVAKFSEENLEE